MNTRSIMAFNACLVAMGCSGEFWKGGATGAALGVAGTSAGSELHARQQLQKLEEDDKAGRINVQGYEIRKTRFKFTRLNLLLKLNPDQVSGSRVIRLVGLRALQGIIGDRSEVIRARG